MEERGREMKESWNGGREKEEECKRKQGWERGGEGGGIAIESCIQPFKSTRTR